MEVLDPVVRVLLELGIEVTRASRSTMTPLHRGVILSSQSSSLSLYRDDVNTLDGHGFAPLHYAVLLHEEKAVEILINLGADVNLLSQIDENRVQEEIPASHSSKLGLSALHMSCQTYRIDIVNKLLDADGVDVNVRSTSDVCPLHLACKHLFLEAVEALVNTRKVDMNAPGGKLSLSPLHVIALNAGPWGNKSNKRDDYDISAYTGNAVDHINYLVEHKSKLNVKDKNGATPLHLAAKIGAIGVLEALTSSGKADVNAHDLMKQTPLHYACQSGITASGSSQSVSLLLKKGANASCVNSRGETALDVLVSLKEKGQWTDTAFLALRVGERQLLSNIQAKEKANAAASALLMEELDSPRRN